VPTFNSCAKIDSTLDSLSRQRDDLWECIVIDGASSDDTMRRVLSRGSRIRSVSEPDRGIYDAMNKGIALATGEWLFFLGAGDIVRPGAFDELLPVINDIPGPAIVYGNVARFGTGQLMGGKATTQRLCYGENIPHQATFYHRSVFDLLGRYSLKYPILADFAFNLQCFGDNRVSTVYVDRVIADYEGGGFSDSSRDESFFRDYPKMIRSEFGLIWTVIYFLRRFAGGTRVRLSRK